MFSEMAGISLNLEFNQFGTMAMGLEIYSLIAFISKCFDRGIKNFIIIGASQGSVFSPTSFHMFMSDNNIYLI